MAGSLRSLPRIPVVQLTGALTRADVDGSSIELVRDVARISTGPAYFFYAPMVVPDATTATALRRQPEIARAFGQLPRVTRAIVGVGSWGPGLSTLYDALSREDRLAVGRLGVCGEVSGSLLDARGHLVDAEVSQRLIAPTAAHLATIPEVIAIAYGTAKTAAVRAALRSGIIGGLVTHSSLAAALLADEPHDDVAPRDRRTG